ncbi:NAD(+)/NADH kinase [[Eubacterium] cellulosolvens]
MKQRCGLVAKSNDEAALNLALKIYRYLISKHVKVIPEKEFAKKKKLKHGTRLEDLDANFIITVGGDGTVLRTCMRAPKPQTPILAVNMGRLGYLTEVEPQDIFKLLDQYLEGRYRLDTHSKLSVSIGDKYLSDSLNEVLITSTSPSKMVHLNVALDKEEFTEFSADGIIISTPTGSTAHAFSAGGPIIHPSLNAFNLVLICPLEPIRAIIVPDNKQVTVRVGKNVSALVTIDGAFNKKIPPDSEAVIKKAQNDAIFIRFGERFLSKTLTRLLSRGIKQSN